MSKRSGANFDVDGNAFNTSISDLMAGLLGIFVLALSFFMLNYSEVTDKYTGNLDKRNEILEKVGQEMKEHGVQVRIDTKQGVLRIPESILFESAEAQIKPEGQDAVRELSRALYEVVSQDEYRQAVETIFIEGHTDNVPIENEYFQSNWELSTQRAINTWNLMRNDTPDLETLRNTQNQPIFSCSGYAETRPVTDDDLDENSEEGRQANRRIDIRFAMTPPDDGKGSK